METRYDRLFGRSVAVWLLAAVGVVVLAGGRSLETYFFVGFVGLLVAMQVAAPPDGRPAWWRMLRGVELVGFLVFAYVVLARRLMLL